MKSFAVARSYKDAQGRSLLIFVRFLSKDVITHVGSRGAATLFSSREDAEGFCPKGYHVDPKAKQKESR